MNDKALFTAFATGLNEALAMYGIPFEVIKGFQPTKQGRVDDGIYYTDLGVVRIGFQQRDYSDDVQGSGLVMTDTLPVAKMIQINTYVKDNPQDMNQITAMDLCEKVAMVVSSWAFVDKMRKHGIGVEKPTEVLQPNFLNEQDQFEANPSFTFIITLPKSISTNVGAVSEVQHHIHRI